MTLDPQLAFAAFSRHDRTCSECQIRIGGWRCLEGKRLLKAWGDACRVQDEQSLEYDEARDCADGL